LVEELCGEGRALNGLVSSQELPQELPAKCSGRDSEAQDESTGRLSCLTKTVNREKDLKRRESAELLRSSPQLAEKKEHYQRPWRKLCNVRRKEFKKHPLPSTIPDQHQCPYLYFTLSKEQGRLHTLHFFK
jgi:hypothetical protein